MRVTVIPSDRWIRRDDETVKLPNWPFDDAGVHAIQWEGDSGEIEYVGKPKPPNELITDPAVLEPYLQAMQEHLDALALQEHLDALALQELADPQPEG